MGFWGSERDGPTVFTECKITLPHVEENSKEKREEYRLNTHMCELTLSHLHTHLHTHTHTHTHTLKEEEVWLVIAVF